MTGLLELAWQLPLAEIVTIFLVIAYCEAWDWWQWRKVGSIDPSVGSDWDFDGYDSERVVVWPYDQDRDV